MPRTRAEDVPAHEKKKISCDEVAWLNNALDRYRDALTLANQEPGVSRARQTARLSATLEIMEIFGLEFQDRLAAGNALSNLPEFDKMKEPEPHQQISVDVQDPLRRTPNYRLQL